MITVLGKLSDTQPYLGRQGYNVMPRRADYSPALNAQWLSEAVDRGDLFLLVSPYANGLYLTELHQLIDLLEMAGRRLSSQFQAQEEESLITNF